MRNSVVSLLFGAKLIGGIGKFIVIKGLPDTAGIVNNCGTANVARVCAIRLLNNWREQRDSASLAGAPPSPAHAL